MRIFLRLGSDISRSDAVSNDRNKPSAPRMADDTAPILVPDGTGIWTFGDPPHRIVEPDGCRAPPRSSHRAAGARHHQRLARASG